jgi:hypothetical protein
VHLFLDWNICASHARDYCHSCESKTQRSRSSDCVRWRLARLLKLKALTVYKIIYSAVDEKPENAWKCLKELVGAKGFEPSTSWSRTTEESASK